MTSKFTSKFAFSDLEQDANIIEASKSDNFKVIGLSSFVFYDVCRTNTRQSSWSKMCDAGLVEAGREDYILHGTECSQVVRRKTAETRLSYRPSQG